MLSKEGIQVLCNFELVYVTYYATRDLLGIAKSIDPGQPTQSDHGRNFPLLADCLCIKW